MEWERWDRRVWNLNERGGEEDDGIMGEVNRIRRVWKGEEWVIGEGFW